MTVYLNLDILLDLAELATGKPPQVRDTGLLSSAAARPATVAFGFEAYEGVWAKAAALLHSLTMNHPLIDGNKRLAWTASRVFLGLNDVPLVRINVDKAEAFVIAVTSHELDAVEDIAAALMTLYRDGS